MVYVGYEGFKWNTAYLFTRVGLLFEIDFQKYVGLFAVFVLALQATNRFKISLKDIDILQKWRKF